MTRDVCAVPPDAEFKDVAVLMARRQISAVPVVGADGTLLGVVSEADLLPTEALPRHARRGRQHKAEATRARELMTAPARTIEIGVSLPVAAGELAASGLRRLFVVDGGRLVGVLARRDLLGVFRRADEQIKAEIETEVFGQTLLASPDCYSVTVRGGQVLLLGRIGRRSEVAAAGELTALVPGVVEVCNRLDYVWDDDR
ncbi:CBS domain-containing protein [Amycolatopsis sp. RM579]|uniref:CBS domain-containing protein n=2 Tax=Amycolatopsis pithecellobii TaxID=664692 RepID=A0A6N7Z4F8_9PSEU|nr:CBS domain-containing protein [Amycolatopsis pithecellobii]